MYFARSERMPIFVKSAQKNFRFLVLLTKRTRRWRILVSCRRFCGKQENSRLPDGAPKQACRLASAGGAAEHQRRYLIMQIRKSHRILAALLALVMLVGLMPAAAFAKSAGNDGSAEMNEAYADRESLMPIGPSFNVDTLLEWTPESDPDAIYSRATISLADREGGFVVNPLANPEAKLMLCSLANSDHDHTSAQGTESFLSYSFNYWQYTDSFVYWSGSEEGLICCPTGEFTDAAHTNGVPVVATLGFPWGPGSGYVEQVQKFVQKAEDGSFPVADKLIEVMDYYGFDGYFFNQESYGCSSAEGELIDEMMRYMHEKRPDMLISWYDSMLPGGTVWYQNAVNDSNKDFMMDSEDGTRAVDEFFMNYNWYSTEVEETIDTMKSIGRSQFDAFAGLDVQQNCMKTTFRDYLLVDEDGLAQLSLALYCPNSTLGLSTSGEDFHEVEQTFYTNAVGDPRDTSVDVTDTYETEWAGMSRFFADKTVILDAPFVTDFNTGHGRGYYVEGELSRDAEWSYQSNQDVLPTWTWIIDSEGSKLDGAYDFSDAYNGGNSLKFFGDLSAGRANDIMLYSTLVKVEEGMKLGLTYKGDQGLMKLVAYYGDESTGSYEDCQQVAYDLTAGSGDWTTTEVDLSASAGKILYAIGLKVESETDLSGYQVNLGRLTLTERTRPTLNGPTGITLDEILYADAYTAEARIYWNNVTGASSYEIYQVEDNGEKHLIMETPSTAFYIPTLSRSVGSEDVTLEIVPINRNGQRGKGAQLTIDWAYADGDTEKIEIVEFENVCLNAKIAGMSAENDGEPASKALDGTAENNSKWCIGGATTGWLSIDLGRPCTIRRWRVEHGEYGGEDPLTNTKDFALEYMTDYGWQEVMRIRNNTLAVTDVLLDEPVTAQQWRLRIYDDGDSPWPAVRIYEWQMFETSEFPQAEPVPMQFATAVNGAGATDTFTLTNVPEGQTVKVYTSIDAEEPIDVKEAVESTVSFTGLDFGTAEAGRIYYTCTAVGSVESAKMSAPFDAESAEQSAAAEDVTFEKYSRNGSSSSSNGDEIYTTLTVNGLAAGDVVYVYEDGESAGYTRVSLPVAEGETSVQLDGIRVIRAGGSLALQVKRVGQLISDVYTVQTPKFAEPEAEIALYAVNADGTGLTGVLYGVYNTEGEWIAEIGTTSDSGGRVSLPLGTYTLKCESVPGGYVVNTEEVLRILRIENWTYDVEVLIAEGEGNAESVKAELQAYYEKLLEENQYSEAGKAELAAVLAEGLETLQDGMTTSELTAALAEAKAALDAVMTYSEELEAAKDAAEAAAQAAEAAKQEAEAAQAAAEAARKAAAEAAASAAEDKEAAENAQAAAEAAQAKAEAAKAAAETAQKAAEDAAAAAEASNLAAAQEAQKAAENAALAAGSAAEAAKSAEAAAQAQKGAQEAQAAAEAAQAKAEEAQKAAEEAAGAAAEDKAAAEAAQAKAEEARAKAEEAQAKAEEAKAAAAAAAEAAEASNLAAAQEAQKAAAEAAAAAESAAEAAESAAKAADAQAKAQAAQAAAEAAQKVAEEAQQKAEEAQKKAEEAADTTAEDREAAERAAEEAKEAQAAAESAQAAAEEAQAAAEAAKEAAEAANQEAAASAALAAEYAQKVTETYGEIVKIKAEMVEFLADAQKAAEEAEAAQKAAEEAQKKAEEAALASAKYYALMELIQVDTSACNAEQKQAVEAVQAEAREAVEAAESREEVEAILAEARKALQDAMNLVCASEMFEDVALDAWYHEGVDYMVRGGYMEGVSSGIFGINSQLTRGQLVTILYRIAGEPSVEGLENPFEDVQAGRYYTEAVIWAAGEGIVEGTSEGIFRPEKMVTREQLATILYRYSGESAVEEDVLAGYPDGGKVSTFAKEGMNWAVSKGLITGVANGTVTTLNPRGAATRAQIATILMRFLENQ